MKVLLTTLTLVVLFVAGVAGTYFVMPMVAPERVEHARRYLDSLDQVASMDSAALAALPPAAPAPEDSALVDTMPPLDAETPTAASTSDPTLGGTVASPVASASLPAKAAEVTGAQAASEAHERRREQAREMATVIAKLEDADLRTVVAQLDPDVLTLLYREASVRNKTRLLQAIPPEKAGSFVRTLITPIAEK